MSSFSFLPEELSTHNTIDLDAISSNNNNVRQQPYVPPGNYTSPRQPSPPPPLPTQKPPVIYDTPSKNARPVVKEPE